VGRVLGLVAAVPPALLAAALFVFSSGSLVERIYVATFPGLLALRLAVGRGRAPGFLALAVAGALGALVAWFFTRNPIGLQPYGLWQRLRYAELLAGVAALPLCAQLAFRKTTQRIAAVAIAWALYLPIALVALEVHRAHVDPVWPAAEGPEPRVTEVASDDGTVLRGWVLPGRTPGSPLVLLLHGVGASRADMVHLARTHSAHGYAVALFDSRGHGESDGMTVSFGLREKKDVRAIIEALTHGHPDTPVALQGCSMGAAVAIQAAAEIPEVRAVVAEAPFYDLESMARAQLADLPGLVGRTALTFERAIAPLELGGPLEQVSPAHAIQRRPELRTLIIVGTHDRMIDPSNGRRLRALAAGRAHLWEIPGAEHCGGWAAAPEEFPRRVSDVLRAAFRPTEGERGDLDAP
jgi:uncharacterized protein